MNETKKVPAGKIPAIPSDQERSEVRTQLKRPNHERVKIRGGNRLSNRYEERGE